MRAAPACELALQPGRTERWACLALLAFTGATLGAWLSMGWAAWRSPWVHPELATALAAIAAGGLCLSLSARPVRRSLAATAVRLRWTGQGWQWTSSCQQDLAPAQIPQPQPAAGGAAAQGVQPPVALELAIDLGPWVLVHARLPTPIEGPGLRRPWPWARSGSRSRWGVAAQWRCSPGDWHAMRVAWQAHAGFERAPAVADRLPERPADDR